MLALVWNKLKRWCSILLFGATKSLKNILRWVQKKWVSIPRFPRFLLGCSFSVVILLVVILMITYYLAAVSSRHYEDKFHIVTSAEVLAISLIVFPILADVMMMYLVKKESKQHRSNTKMISICTPSRKDIEVNLLRHVLCVFGVGCILYLASEISDRRKIAQNKSDLFVNGASTVTVHGILWILAIVAITRQVYHGLSPQVLEAMRSNRGSFNWRLVRGLNIITAILMLVDLLHDYFVLPQIHSFLPPRVNDTSNSASTQSIDTAGGIHEMEFTLFAAVTGFDMHAFCGMILIAVMMGKRPSITWTPVCDLFQRCGMMGLGHYETKPSRLIFLLGRRWVLVFTTICLGFLFIAEYAVIPDGVFAEVLSMSVETVTTTVAVTLTWFMVGSPKFPKFNNVESFVMVPALVAVTVLGCASVFRLISSDVDGLDGHHIIELCYNLVQIVCCLFQAVVVISMAKSLWVRQAISRHAPISDFNRLVAFRFVSALLAVANVVLWTANAFFDARYLKEKVLSPLTHNVMTTVANCSSMAQVQLFDARNSTGRVLESVWPSIQLWSVPWVVELYMVFAILYSAQFLVMNVLLEVYYAVHSLAVLTSGRNVEYNRCDERSRIERSQCLLDITRIALRPSGAKQINYTGGTVLVMEVGEEWWDDVAVEFIHCVAVLSSYESCRNTLCSDQRLLTLLTRELPKLPTITLDDPAVLSSLYRIYLNMSEDKKLGPTYMSELFRVGEAELSVGESNAATLMFKGLSILEEHSTGFDMGTLDVSTLCLMILHLLNFNRCSVQRKLSGTRAYMSLIKYVNKYKPSHSGALQLIVTLLRLCFPIQGEGLKNIGVPEGDTELLSSMTVLAELSGDVTSNEEAVAFASYGYAILYNHFRKRDTPPPLLIILELPVRACVPLLTHEDKRLQATAVETIMICSQCLKGHPERESERKACIDSIPKLVKLCSKETEEVRMFAFQALDALLQWRDIWVGIGEEGDVDIPQNRSQLRIIDLGLMDIKCQSWITFLKCEDVATVESVESLLLQCLERDALTRSSFIVDLREAVGEILRSLMHSRSPRRRSGANNRLYTRHCDSGHIVEIFSELPHKCALMMELKQETPEHPNVIRNLVTLYIELVFQNARRVGSIPKFVVSLLADIVSCDRFHSYAAEKLLTSEARVLEKRDRSIASQNQHNIINSNAQRGGFTGFLSRAKHGLTNFFCSKGNLGTVFCWGILYILRKQISDSERAGKWEDGHDAFQILWELSAFPDFWKTERQFDVGGSFTGFTEILMRTPLSDEEIEERVSKWENIAVCENVFGIQQRVEAHATLVRQKLIERNIRIQGCS